MAELEYGNSIFSDDMTDAVNAIGKNKPKDQQEEEEKPNYSTASVVASGFAKKKQAEVVGLADAYKTAGDDVTLKDFLMRVSNDPKEAERRYYGSKQIQRNLPGTNFEDIYQLYPHYEKILFGKDSNVAGTDWTAIADKFWAGKAQWNLKPYRTQYRKLYTGELHAPEGMYPGLSQKEADIKYAEWINDTKIKPTLDHLTKMEDPLPRFVLTDAGKAFGGTFWPTTMQAMRSSTATTAETLAVNGLASLSGVQLVGGIMSNPALLGSFYAGLSFFNTTKEVWEYSRDERFYELMNQQAQLPDGKTVDLPKNWKLADVISNIGGLGEGLTEAGFGATGMASNMLSGMATPVKARVAGAFFKKPKLNKALMFLGLYGADVASNTAQDFEESITEGMGKAIYNTSLGYDGPSGWDVLKEAGEGIPDSIGASILLGVPGIRTNLSIAKNAQRIADIGKTSPNKTEFAYGEAFQSLRPEGMTKEGWARVGEQYYDTFADDAKVQQARAQNAMKDKIQETIVKNDIINDKAESGDISEEEAVQQKKDLNEAFKNFASEAKNVDALFLSDPDMHVEKGFKVSANANLQFKVDDTSDGGKRIIFYRDVEGPQKGPRQVVNRMKDKAGKVVDDIKEKAGKSNNAQSDDRKTRENTEKEQQEANVKKKTAYAYIDYTVNPNGSVEIDADGVHVAQDLLGDRREETLGRLFNILSDQNRGKEIIWDTDVNEGLDALKKKISGKESGSLRFTDSLKGMEGNKVTQAILKAFPQVTLDEASVATPVLQAVSRMTGLSVDRLIEAYHPYDGSKPKINEDKLEAWAKSRGITYQTGDGEAVDDGIHAVVFATRHGDFSTFIHESAHLASYVGLVDRSDFNKAIRKDATSKTGALAKYIDAHRQIFWPSDDKNGVYAQEKVTNGTELAQKIGEYFGKDVNTAWNPMMEEVFANMMESYLSDGKNRKADTETGKVLEKIRGFMSSIYQSMVNNKVQMPKNTKEVFDKWFAGDMKKAGRGNADAGQPEKGKKKPKFEAKFDENGKPKVNFQPALESEDGSTTVNTFGNDLFVMNGMEPGAVVKYNRLGGIPMPSLAIAHKGNRASADYGKITLLGNAQLGDELIKEGAIYGGDLWTERMPKREERVYFSNPENNGKVQAYSSRLMNIVEQVKANIGGDGLFDDTAQDDTDSEELSSASIDKFSNLIASLAEERNKAIAETKSRAKEMKKIFDGWDENRKARYLEDLPLEERKKFGKYDEKDARLYFLGKSFGKTETAPYSYFGMDFVNEYIRNHDGKYDVNKLVKQADNGRYFRNDYGEDVSAIDIVSDRLPSVEGDDAKEAIADFKKSGILDVYKIFGKQGEEWTHDYFNLVKFLSQNLQKYVRENDGILKTTEFGDALWESIPQGEPEHKLVFFDRIKKSYEDATPQNIVDYMSSLPFSRVPQYDVIKAMLVTAYGEQNPRSREELRELEPLITDRDSREYKNFRAEMKKIYDEEVVPLAKEAYIGTDKENAVKNLDWTLKNHGWGIGEENFERYFGKNQKLADAIGKMVDIAKNVHRPYLEAKPKRVLSFKDFSVAIIPNNLKETDPEAYKILRANKLKMYKYDVDNSPFISSFTMARDRVAQTTKALREHPDILFQSALDDTNASLNQAGRDAGMVRNEGRTAFQSLTDDPKDNELLENLLSRTKIGTRKLKSGDTLWHLTLANGIDKWIVADTPEQMKEVAQLLINAFNQRADSDALLRRKSNGDFTNVVTKHEVALDAGEDLSYLTADQFDQFSKKLSTILRSDQRVGEITNDEIRGYLDTLKALKKGNTVIQNLVNEIGGLTRKVQVTKANAKYRMNEVRATTKARMDKALEALAGQKTTNKEQAKTIRELNNELKIAEAKLSKSGVENEKLQKALEDVRNSVYEYMTDLHEKSQALRKAKGDLYFSQKVIESLNAKQAKADVAIERLSVIAQSQAKVIDSLENDLAYSDQVNADNEEFYAGVIKDKDAEIGTQKGLTGLANENLRRAKEKADKLDSEAGQLRMTANNAEEHAKAVERRNAELQAEMKAKLEKEYAKQADLLEAIGKVKDMLAQEKADRETLVKESVDKSLAEARKQWQAKESATRKFKKDLRNFLRKDPDPARVHWAFSGVFHAMRDSLLDRVGLERMSGNYRHSKGYEAVKPEVQKAKAEKFFDTKTPWFDLHTGKYVENPDHTFKMVTYRDLLKSMVRQVWATSEESFQTAWEDFEKSVATPVGEWKRDDARNVIGVMNLVIKMGELVQGNIKMGRNLLKEQLVDSIENGQMKVRGDRVAKSPADAQDNLLKNQIRNMMMRASQSFTNIFTVVDAIEPDKNGPWHEIVRSYNVNHTNEKSLNQQRLNGLRRLINARDAEGKKVGGAKPVDLNELYKPRAIKYSDKASVVHSMIDGVGDITDSGISLTPAQLMTVYIAGKGGNQKNIDAIKYGILMTQDDAKRFASLEEGRNSSYTYKFQFSEEEMEAIAEEKETDAPLTQYELSKHTPESQKEFMRLADKRFDEVFAEAEKVIDGDETLKAVVGYIQNDFKEYFPMVNSVTRSVYNTDLYEDQNYLPIQRLFMLYGDNDTNANLLSSLMDGSYLSSTAGIEKGFTIDKQEIGMLRQTPSNIDLISLYMRHVMDTDHLMAFAEWGQKYGGLFKDATTAQDMRTVMDKYFGDYTMKYLTDWTNEVINPKNRRAPRDKLIQFLNGNLGASVLAFNTSVVATQAVTSFEGFMPVLGPKNYGRYFKALFSLLKKDFRIPMLDADGKEILDSSGNRIYRDVNLMEYVRYLSPLMRERDVDFDAEGIRLSRENRTYYGERAQGLMGKLGDINDKVVKEWGMYMLNGIDHIEVFAGWYALYEMKMDELKAKGVALDEADRQAREFAEYETARVQPSGDKNLQSPIYNKFGDARFFLMFTNSLNLVFNNEVQAGIDIVNAFRKEGGGFVNPFNKKEGDRYLLDDETRGRILSRAVQTFAWTAVSGLLVGMLKNFDPDDEPEEKVKKIAYWFMSQGIDTIPLIGTALDNALYSVVAGEPMNILNGGTGVTPFRGVDDIIQGLQRTLSGRDAKKATQNGFYLMAEGIGTLWGLPTNELGKLIDYLGGDSKADSLWDFLTGHRTK